MPRRNPQPGEMPPHRQDEAARQQDARPNANHSQDTRGRDKGRSGSDSNR